ncbi:MAG: bifunctional tRNA (5-methylaminomethyl-2-thiouridine)(34)-methyltransferase MnmD/FAD-dependent 5-carboxymethylaminomethyl-2-thiouridine(34) oxidoreductase MnmC [Betaproteobacteria bacterium]|nr:bifunctional tRNA (5-methylaminomethyl-2-thiouridine)(34)-methyltransferase MnmD/FAD-dependent 5-carboxymethylaminomethyl-2-thiouridine(34) oxidoreductase MnmC [Betaproteobacteria bacterium]
MTGRSVCVVPARLERTPEGVPYAPQFQDIYHSAEGGLAQARQVFLAGNRLPERWRGRDSFTILETGFGLGLNFLAAWDALRADPLGPARLHFVSVERHPFAPGDLAAALEPFEELRPLTTALLAVWPLPLAGFHRLAFDGGRVHLTLMAGDARALLPQLEASADALFLDGFSPAKNPEMWSPEVVRELARLAAPGATLATWTVAGGVRAALAGAGFHVEKREGFGPKREMLVGTRDGESAPTPPTQRRAVIVGAGLAGTMCAERLASRGWETWLIDTREKRPVETAGLVRPIANLRDAVNAQVSRPAFLFALQFFRALQHDGYHLVWNRCGVLQLADGDDEAARMAAIVEAQCHPPDFLRYVDAAEARAIAGRPVRGPGWWMPSGAWISPGSLAIALLARAGGRVRRLIGRSVERLEREGAEWRAIDADGAVIAEAPTLIVANAFDAKRLLPEARLTLSRVRGQVTFVPPSATRVLDVVVSGSGYISPLPDGGHVAGATYQHDDAGEDIRVADHRDNLARLDKMLPGFAGDLDPASLSGLTGFRATVPDRLPIFGATLVPGIWTATGLGSRGLLWAPIGAELIASRLEGEPSPLPRDLAGAISPRRFLS